VEARARAPGAGLTAGAGRWRVAARTAAPPRLRWTRMAIQVKAKKSCCKDDPRCRRCPVVLKRLAAAGLAERVDKRTYLVVDTLREKELKAARSSRKQGAR